MPKNGVPPTERERGRLARLDRDAVKDHLAARRDDVDDQIAFADRAAARKHDQVGAGARVERRRSARRRVSCAGAVRLRRRRRARRRSAPSVKRLTSKICPGASGCPGSTTSLPVDRIATRGFAKTSTSAQPIGRERADAARRQQIAGARPRRRRRRCRRRGGRCSGPARPARRSRRSSPSPVAVSSTMTTASAPAGSGAPVAISAQVPRRRSTARRLRRCRCDRRCRSRAGAARVAPAVSAAITA